MIWWTISFISMRQCSEYIIQCSALCSAARIPYYFIVHSSIQQTLLLRRQWVEWELGKILVIIRVFLLSSYWLFVHQFKQKNQLSCFFNSKSVTLESTRPNDKNTLSTPADEAVAVNSCSTTRTVSGVERSAWDFHQSIGFPLSSTSFEIFSLHVQAYANMYDGWDFAF